MEKFVAEDDLSKYTLILLVSPTKLSKVLKPVADLAWKRSIPLFYIHSVGFFSQFSIQIPSLFPVVDTHPDPVSTQDLRLLKPWWELLELAKERTAGLVLLSDHDHGHVPYLLLLLKYLEDWKTTHNGKYPQNYKEKTIFRDLVKSGARADNAEGGEENFDEAVAAVVKSLNEPSIPSGLLEIFEEEACRVPKTDVRTKHPKHLNPFQYLTSISQSPNFWIIANAIMDFVKTYEVLPLPGALPDMKAKSAEYIQLQNVYKNKARQDVAEVTHHVRILEQDLGRKSAIAPKDIEAFCKGAAFVKLVRGSRLRIASEPKSLNWGERAKSIVQELGDESSLMPIYLAFLALDHDLETYPEPAEPTEAASKSPSPAPAHSGGEFAQSRREAAMHQYMTELLQHLPKTFAADEGRKVSDRLVSVVEEFDRAGSAELHNISALTGGMVAQEVIKVITNQYVPINNTCVFDGITSKASVFRL